MGHGHSGHEISRRMSSGDLMTLDMLTQLGGSGAREARDHGRVRVSFEPSLRLFIYVYHVATTSIPCKACARYQVRTHPHTSRYVLFVMAPTFLRPVFRIPGRGEPTSVHVPFFPFHSGQVPGVSQLLLLGGYLLSDFLWNRACYL